MKTYYPTINLLRGVAAIMVCMFHFIGYTDFRGNLFPAGDLISNMGRLGVNGVYVFFVISGFVIPLSLSKGDFKLKQLPKFLLRRFIRIEIPYIVSILFILFVGFLFVEKNNLVYTINVERFLLHLVYLIPFSEFDWYNVIYWTLAIEFQFYIVIGVIYFFLSSVNTKTIILAILIFFLLNFITHDNRLIFDYSTIFLQGILLFLIKTKKLSNKIGFIFLGLCVIATAYLHSMEISFFSLLTVLVIQFFEINNKWTKHFGDISYSLYLTHGLVGGNILYLFSRYTTRFSGKISLVLVALIVSLFFSYVYWRFIEDPSRRLSKKVNIAEQK